MLNHLACFPRYPLTCKSPVVPFLGPRLLAPWPEPTPPRLLLAQAQKRGIAVGRQAQEAQAEVGNETVRNIGHVIRRTASGDPRMFGKRPSTSLRRSKQSQSIRLRYRFILRLKGLKLSNTRTKYVSLGSHRGRLSSSFSTAWNVRYTQLVKRFNKDANQSGSPGGRPLGVEERPIKNPWARQIAAAAAVDLDKFKKIWANLDWGKKRLTWPIVMHWALSHYPERALAILFATLSNTHYTPPPFAVADSLDYLSCMFLQDGSQPDPALVQRIRAMVSYHIEGCKAQTDNFRGVTQRTIYLLTKHCRGKQQIRLYDTIRQCNTFLHTNTLLHLMDSFIEVGDLATAMEILQRIVNSGADLKLDQVQKGCAKLLRGGSELEDSHQIRYRIRSNMLAQMLEMGVPPNLMMYNVILLNAVEHGQMNFAHRVYAMIEASKFEPDAYTYSILLKGVKHGMDDIFVSKLLQLAKDNGVLSQCPHLIAQLLHVTYLYRSNHEGYLAFNELVPIYEQYMDNRPLKELGLLRDRTDMTSHSQVELMQAPPPVLGMMIAVYLMQHRNSDHIPALYARYHELVEADHPLIAPLAETDYTANVFLKVLGRRRENLPLCTTIFEHMLKAPASPTTKRAAPTVQSWSILLAAFMGHGQATAGEKVLTMMHDRGMQPNQVTWNSLLGGYAGMQDVDGTIGAMRRMEKAGYVVEEATMEAWGRVVDRRRLMQAFERAVREEEQASLEQANLEHDHVDTEDK